MPQFLLFSCTKPERCWLLIARGVGSLGGKQDDLHGPSLAFEDALVLTVQTDAQFVCKGPMMTGTNQLLAFCY